MVRENDAVVVVGVRVFEAAVPEVAGGGPELVEAPRGPHGDGCGSGGREVDEGDVRDVVQGMKRQTEEGGA